MSETEQRRERRRALVQERHRAAAAQERRDRFMKWGIALGTAVVVAVLVGGIVWANMSQSARGLGGLPGPLGGPSVAQDVNTLVGTPAPAFTLSDADGKSHSVTPGQGRPLVLITHMGIG